MNLQLHFTFMSGAGNYFYFIDNRNNIISNKSEFTKNICSTSFLKHADGTIFIENCSEADFKMDYYNSDGSFGMMCGNGGRCSVKYVITKNICKNNILRFLAGYNIYSGKLVQDEVEIQLNSARNIKLNQFLDVNNNKIKYHFVDTGAPHCVIFLNENPVLNNINLENLDIKNLGREIRFHKNFVNGTNVNFCLIVDKDFIINRTYERGVEEETLACGTGSSAVVYLSNKLGYTNENVQVKVKSGENLEVKLDNLNNTINLKGSADILFEGTLFYNNLTNEVAKTIEN